MSEDSSLFSSNSLRQLVMFQLFYSYATFRWISLAIVFSHFVAVGDLLELYLERNNKCLSGERA